MSGFESEFRYTQNLLFEWSVKHWATVGALLEALSKMGRDDAYDVLASYIVKRRLRQVDQESDIVIQHGVSDTSFPDSASNASCTTQLIRSRDSDVSGMYSESSI